MIKEPKLAWRINEGFLVYEKSKGRFDVWGRVIQVKDAEGKCDPGKGVARAEAGR